MYGLAIIDCAGICGGASHFGDINQDYVLDSTDYFSYLDLLSNGPQNISSCLDLDGNGKLTVYDALLVADCLDNYNENDPLHNHCPFPKSKLDRQAEA